VAVEDGEHVAGDVLRAVAEDGGENLVPALGADARRVLGDQRADLAQRLLRVRGEAGADVLGRCVPRPLRPCAALAPAAEANHG
jgi:hypothetical protein